MQLEKSLTVLLELLVFYQFVNLKLYVCMAGVKSKCDSKFKSYKIQFKGGEMKG